MGQRRTRQRDVINHVITAAPGPLTAPEIHVRAQRAIPGLGIATVYRTLKLMLDANQVRTVVLPCGETRYEAYNLAHHHHFHCRICNQVFDLSCCPMTMPHELPMDPGFVVDSHEITYYGRCPACTEALRGGRAAVPRLDRVVVDQRPPVRLA
ncbi:MAG TPA: transcriptional repressor [Longimicrobium sp.]|nr:transcriptional repressor [Longimicrobium sp.]